jgi:hypothetical protein
VCFVFEILNLYKRKNRSSSNQGHRKKTVCKKINKKERKDTFAALLNAEEERKKENSFEIRGV